MEEKLLLVDDEEGIRKVLGMSLADRGYRGADGRKRSGGARACSCRTRPHRVDRHQDAGHGRHRTAPAHQGRTPGHRGHHDHRPWRHGAGHREPQVRGHRLRHQADQRRRAGDRAQARRGAAGHAAADPGAHRKPRTAGGGKGRAPGGNSSGWPPSTRPSTGFPSAFRDMAGELERRDPLFQRNAVPRRHPRPEPQGGRRQPALPASGWATRSGADSWEIYPGAAAAPNTARWPRPSHRPGQRKREIVTVPRRHRTSHYRAHRPHPQPRRRDSSWCSRSPWTFPRSSG